MYGFYKTAACVPVVRVGDVSFNLEHILSLARKASDAGCAVVLFPEMALTSYSCWDLFHHSLLLESAEKALETFMREMKDSSTVFVLGLPVPVDGKVFNGAAVVQKGHLAGITLKTRLPQTAEFHEKRLFAGADELIRKNIDFASCRNVPIGNDLIYESGKLFSFGIEICFDMFAAVTPGSLMAAAGAKLILNPAASTEHAGKAGRRLSNIRTLSANGKCAYLYASCGVHESTTDTVCGGHCAAFQNGELLLDSPRFRREDTMDLAELDMEALESVRRDSPPFAVVPLPAYRYITLEPVPEPEEQEIQYRPSSRPFIPADPAERKTLLHEVFEIQTAALIKRIEHVNAKKLVLGVSGGLDSTLALLVCANALKTLNRPASDLLAVTMPGFGTSERTFGNASELCRLAGAELREVPIRDACRIHFRDIGLDPEERGAAYENSQARERTQILLDLANLTGGICIGTGDLSECALGWCTFNGDHIAMYGVNASVPKTLMRHIILDYADRASAECAAVLRDIVDTPVSPELLPADKEGKIAQKTEEIIGPYDVHDFLIYRFMTTHDSPEKLLFLLKRAFPEIPAEDLSRYLGIFLKRFFSQQFKRNCSTEAPAAGPVSFSPRGGLMMASDFSGALWLNGRK